MEVRVDLAILTPLRGVESKPGLVPGHSLEDSALPFLILFSGYISACMLKEINPFEDSFRLGPVFLR